MPEDNKWIYGVFGKITGNIVYKNKTNEETATNEIKKLGYRVISKSKTFSKGDQIVLICYR